MKRIFSILIIVLLGFSTFAQSPQKMSYQSVIRDSENQLVTNQEVGMQISILQTSVSGTSVYIETQTPTSNANGLLSIEIGSGTIVSGTFADIDWADGPYFLKTETDPAGGTNYTITGTSQLLSVPFALHANTAETVTGAINETDPVYSAWTKDYADLSNKPNIIDSVSTVIDTSSQFVRSELDGDPSNEIQDLTYTSNLLSIENGNSVTIKESPWNISGNNIYYNTGLLGIGVSSPTASLDIYDNVGYHFFNFVSEDNVYTTWRSDRAGVHDYQVGIDGGNNKFMIANTTTGYFPLIIHDGNTGIGTYSPEAPLHITDFMKLEPRTVAPSSASEGMIYYDSNDHKLKVYNGVIWVDLN